MSTCIYALNIYLEKKEIIIKRDIMNFQTLNSKKICLIHHLKIALSFTDVNEKH